MKKGEAEKIFQGQRMRKDVCSTGTGRVDIGEESGGKVKVLPEHTPPIADGVPHGDPDVRQTFAG